jgi:peptide chain release factor subunit 3
MEGAEVADSWEDQTEDEPVKAAEEPKPKMNPFAASFNPQATAFVPSWMKKPDAAPETEAPAAPPAPVEEPKEDTEAAAEPAEGVKTLAEIEAEELAMIEAEEAAAEESAPVEADPAVVEETTTRSKKFEPPPMSEAEIAKKKLKLVNIVFIGHVDAGKSTLSGHIMYLTGMLDDRTLAKYEQEAKSKNRESWKFAWAMDVTDQERAKGKTEECGRAYFETEKKRFVIIDAPGHKSFVPHMIGGAAQADVAVMVISARKGEFETGFEKGGQTREHALLAKTAGVRRLIVVINKMDDPTVEWSSERYQECVDKFTPYLRQVGFNVKEVKFMPVSGLGGHNLRDRLAPGIFDYYQGPSLLECLDEMRAPKRMLDMPLRMPLVGGYKEMGFIVVGKIEAGTANVNGQYILLPSRTKVRVEQIAVESEDGLTVAETGDNVRMMIKGISDEKELQTGLVLSDIERPVKVTKQFICKVSIMESKNIICAGYTCIMHIHTLTVECRFGDLLAIENKKDKKIVQKKPQFVRASEKQFVIVRMEVDFPICIEEFSDFAQLGRFMLRDEGKTIGIGMVTKIKEEK